MLKIETVFEYSLAFMEPINLSNVTIILHRPRFPENIGSAARAVANMGLSNIRVVEPEDYDLTKILKLATHAVMPVVSAIEVFDNLAEAVAPYQYLMATTARTGRFRHSSVNPRSAVKKLAPLTLKNKVGVLFGPEDRGLSNDEMKFCQDAIVIPTLGFHSLNVSQAVMVVCWELRRFLLEDSSPEPESADAHPSAELATSHDVEGLYAHLEETLVRIEFLDPKNPEYWMRNIRRMFNRFPLRKVDVNFFRGLCRQINWYINNRM